MVSELTRRKSLLNEENSFIDSGDGESKIRRFERASSNNEQQQPAASALPPSPPKTKKSKATRGRRLVSNFSQQKLRAWQPVLTPKWIVSVFIGFGILFGVIGIILLVTSNRVIECTVPYRDPSNACDDNRICSEEMNITIRPENCLGLKNGNISPPVFLYYELTNYYQNHRRYVRSRNDEQLRGHVFTHPDDISSCDPIITGPGDKLLSPCGLVAWSVFNDTFKVYAGGEQVVDDASVIAWATDVQHRFKNPKKGTAPSHLVLQWLNEEIFPNKVENGHFIVWMRSAALPSFRKLYAKIESEMQLPITVSIANRYPVESFNGEKRIVISTTSWLGGRNNFLGIAYIVISVWCLLFGVIFIFKNYENPRILGDVRYLKWVSNRRSK